MQFQINFIESAPHSHIVTGFAEYDARAAQAIEIFCCARVAPGKQSSHYLANARILRQHYQQPAQMISKRSFVAHGTRGKCFEGYVTTRHLMQAAPGKVRMPT